MGLAQQLFGGFVTVHDRSLRGLLLSLLEALHSCSPTTTFWRLLHPSCAPATICSSAPPHQQATSSPGPNRRSKCPPERYSKRSKMRKAVHPRPQWRATSGKVIGDVSPPTHINAAPRPLSPPAPFVHSSTGFRPEAPPMTHGSTSGHSKRESVDWYTGLGC